MVGNPDEFKRRLQLLDDFVVVNGIGRRLTSPADQLPQSILKYTGSDQRLKMGDRVLVKRWFRQHKGQIVRLPTKEAPNIVLIKFRRGRPYPLKLMPCSDFAPRKLALLARATHEEARKFLTFWG